MVRPLPYPGHSWSFTQHAVALDPKTLYDLLMCAASFEGQLLTEECKAELNKMLIAAGVLTTNERDGVLEPWRDYQQVLPELGLIFSTKICRVLTLTELGHMFLAGEVGFSELMGVQALRFQYPNGQKSTIQARLRGELLSASIAAPETLTELQVNRQILLKPGALVLRVLLELSKAGLNPSLSLQECRAFLIPCRTNSEWHQAYLEVTNNRVSPSNLSSVYTHCTRNLQDWFKFLKKSDYFGDDVAPDQVSLSSYSMTHMQEVDDYCALQEDPATFWVPTDFDIPARLKWFGWFGHLPYNAQKAFRLDLNKAPEYVKENYVAGVDEDEDDDEAISPELVGLNLKPLDLAHLGRDTPFQFTGDLDGLIANLRKGAQKRHAKTLLHDRIIKELAEAFIEQGARVESDPDSIDLFAAWPSGKSAIFEVKTVTRRSLQTRLRSAIGQVEEYAYRRQCAGTGISDRVVVVNTELDSKAWQTAFLTEHLGIGLICKPTSSYGAFAPASAQTKEHWLNLG